MIIKTTLSSLPVLPVFLASLEDVGWNWATEMIQSIFKKADEVGASVSNILSGDESIIGQVQTRVMEITENQIAPTMSSIGIAFALTFWLISFIEMVTEDRMSPEMFVKSFAKLFLGIGFCIYATDIMQTIRNFGDAFCKMVADIPIDSFGSSPGSLPENITDKTQLIAQIKASNEDMNFFTVLGSVCIMVIPILLGFFVLQGVCYVIQMTRILEMGIRGAFLPIAFGMMSDDGWRGAGGRYFKKYLAICCQGAVLTIIGRLTMLIISTTLYTYIDMPDAFKFIGILELGIIILGTGIGCVSVMFKSIGFVNDIFGA